MIDRELIEKAGTGDVDAIISLGRAYYNWEDGEENQGKAFELYIALSRNRRYFCTAELENCYVVDEKGNLYKCWDEIGKEEFVCMNLLDRTQVNYCAISRFVADDPFDANSKCRMCKFLPLCFGGCRYQKNYFGRTKCSFTSAGMIQYIENKYFHL